MDEGTRSAPINETVTVTTEVLPPSQARETIAGATTRPRDADNPIENTREQIAYFFSKLATKIQQTHPELGQKLLRDLHSSTHSTDIVFQGSEEYTVKEISLIQLLGKSTTADLKSFAPSLYISPNKDSATQPKRPTTYKLTSKEGLFKDGEFTLVTKDVWTIGRSDPKNSRSSDTPLSENLSLVSRTHAILKRVPVYEKGVQVEEKFQIEDKSTNGTSINNGKPFKTAEKDLDPDQDSILKLGSSTDPRVSPGYVEIRTRQNIFQRKMDAFIRVISPKEAEQLLRQQKQQTEVKPTVAPQVESQSIPEGWVSTTITDDIWEIGRVLMDSSHGTVIEEPNISKEHCAIRLTNKGVLIQDHGSTNGTYVNGERIPANFFFPLADGVSQIRLGVVNIEIEVAPSERGDGRKQVILRTPTREALQAYEKFMFFLQAKDLLTALNLSRRDLPSEDRIITLLEKVQEKIPPMEEVDAILTTPPLPQVVRAHLRRLITDRLQAQQQIAQSLENRKTEKQRIIERMGTITSVEEFGELLGQYIGSDTTPEILSLSLNLKPVTLQRTRIQEILSDFIDDPRIITHILEVIFKPQEAKSNARFDTVRTAVSNFFNKK